MAGKTEEAAKEAAATPPVASAQPKVDVFEDDDEFEEFENEDWSAEEEDTTAVQQWEDDWDDDDVGDDFSKHLRAELEKGEGQKQGGRSSADLHHKSGHANSSSSHL